MNSVNFVPSLLLTIATATTLFAASVAHAPVALAQPAATAARDSLTATEFGTLVQRLSGPAGWCPREREVLASVAPTPGTICC